MVCAIDVDKHKYYASPIESGMPGNRRLGRSKRKSTQSDWCDDEETIKFKTIDENFTNKLFAFRCIWLSLPEFSFMSLSLKYLCNE